MKRQRMFFLYNDLLYDVLKPEITLKKIKVTEVKIENEEYKEIRRKYNEDIFLIEKLPDGWCVTKKV